MVNRTSVVPYGSPTVANTAASKTPKSGVTTGMKMAEAWRTAFQSAPSTWLMEANRNMMLALFVLLAAFGVVWCILSAMGSQRDLLIQIIVTLLIMGGAVPAILALGFLSSPRLQTYIVFPALLLVIAGFGGLLFVQEDACQRHHWAFGLELFWKIIWSRSGFSFPLTVAIIMWSAAVDIIIYMVAPMYHGQSSDIGDTIRVVVTIPLYIVWARMYQQQYLQMWTDHKSAEGERRVVSGVLSAVSFGTEIRILGEGKEAQNLTVLQSSANFDRVMGQRVTPGRRFLQEFVPGNRTEQLRLQQAFGRAVEGAPVVLHTTLSPKPGAWQPFTALICKAEMDCTIQEQRQCNLKGPCVAFLVAIRADEKPPENVLDRNIGVAGALPTNAQPAEAVEADRVSVYTSQTGRIFAQAGARGSGLEDMFNVMRLGEGEHWLISPEELILYPHRVLGCGSFGAVVAADYHGSPAAVKVPRKRPELEGDEVQRALPLLHELRMLRYLRHPNIVLFHGACFDPTTRDVSLVFEEISGRTLREWILNRGISKIEGDVRKALYKMLILRDIARGLRYLHMQQPALVHGDLKDGNIFVELWEDVPRAKLGDFGLTRRMTVNSQGMSGTLRWSAPEVFLTDFQGAAPAPSADVFSFGRVIHFMVVERRPLESVTEEALRTLAETQGRLPPLDWPMGPLPDGLKHLSRWCMRFLANERPNMEVAQGVLEDELRMAAREEKERNPSNPLVKAITSRGAETQGRSTLNKPWKPWGDQLEEVRRQLQQLVNAQSAPKPNAQASAPAQPPPGGPPPPGTPGRSQRSAPSTPKGPSSGREERGSSGKSSPRAPPSNSIDAKFYGESVASVVGKQQPERTKATTRGREQSERSAGGSRSVKAAHTG